MGCFMHTVVLHKVAEELRTLQDFILQQGTK